jgi:hypothetical protein
VLFALRRDASVAVRLAALTVLVGRLDDDDVRVALMAALQRRSVGPGSARRARVSGVAPGLSSPNS